MASRPSLFEVWAADSITGSLGEAIDHVVDLLATRAALWAPETVGRLGVLRHLDAAAVLLHLAVEGYNVGMYDATLGEAFYGMRRVAGGATDAPSLTWPTRIAVLVAEVLVPRLKALADDAYERRRGSTVRVADALLAGVSDGSSDDSRDTNPDDEWSDQTPMPLSLYARLLPYADKLFVTTYPWVHAVYTMVTVAMQVLFLGKIWGVSSLLRWLTQTSMRRLTPEQVQAAQSLAARVLGPAGPEAGVVVRWIRALVDSFKYLFPASILAHRIVTWWRAQRASEHPRDTPVPVAPKPLPPAVDGCGLPAVRSHCPLCRVRVTSPAMLVRTGYVFCYPCISTHLATHSHCPVSCVRVLPLPASAPTDRLDALTARQGHVAHALRRLYVDG